MKLAQPPGVRSTSKPDGTPGCGGNWESGRLKTGGTAIHVDFDQLYRFMGSSDLALLKSELHESMKRAEQGLLTYGVDARQGEVCVMDSAPNVLELRLDDYEHYDPELERYRGRKFRAYYSEPASVPNLLVMLSVRAKIPGELGLVEQTRHAKEAEKLSYDHGVIAGIT